MEIFNSEHSVIEHIAQIVTILASLSILFVIYGYIIQKKQFNNECINSCLSDFDKCFDSKGDFIPTKKNSYIDLVNREFFYFQHGYLPIEIAFEWIDGLLSFLPLINKEFENHQINFDNVKLPNNCIIKKYEFQKYINLDLEDYQRIKIAMFINQNVLDKFKKCLTDKKTNTLNYNFILNFFCTLIILKNLGVIKKYSFIKFRKLKKDYDFYLGKTKNSFSFNAIKNFAFQNTKV